MAITPNAPDYVSQVRGILSDLQEDNLKKQQLFQQEQQQNANRALQYAQLNASRDTAAMQAGLNERQLEFNYLQEANKAQQAKDKLDYDAKNQQYELYKDALARDLNERKYNLDVAKEERVIQNDLLERLSKKNQNVRLAEFGNLLNNNDYAGLQKWYAEAQKDTAEVMDYGAMINQASQIASGIEKANEMQKLALLRPQMENFFTESGDLISNLQNFSYADRNQRLADTRTKAANLLSSIKDPSSRDAINSVLSSLDLRQRELKDLKKLDARESFLAIGTAKELSPEIQEEFNVLASAPESERGTEEYIQKQDDLMLRENKLRAENDLKNIAKELAGYEYAQILNPNYTIKQEDGSVSPKFRAPDISSISFRSGILDENNNISEEIKDRINKFRDKMMTSGVAKVEEEDQLSKIVDIMKLARGEKATATTPGGVQPQATTAPKVNFSNVALLGVAQAGAPTAAPVAPSPQQPSPTPPTPTDTTDYRKNQALLDEVDRQIKAGNKTYVKDGQPTKINLTALRNRIVSRMGQRQAATFSPRTPNMVEEAMTPAGFPGTEAE
jgi:hypothetical protein